MVTLILLYLLYFIVGFIALMFIMVALVFIVARPDLFLFSICTTILVIILGKYIVGIFI